MLTAIESSIYLLLFLLAQFGYGNLAFTRLKAVKGFKTSSATAVRFAFGQVLTGSLLTFVALFSRLNNFTLLCIIAPGVIFATKLVPKFRVPQLSKYRNWNTIYSIFVLLLFALSQLLRLLSRPVSDALAYYLAQPKIIAHTHQLTELVGYSSFIQSSSLIESNNAGIYLISGEIGIRVSLLISGILLIKCVVELCRLLEMNDLSIKICVLFMITSTFITNTMADGKTDNTSSLWFMASLWLLVSGLKWNHTGLVFLSGIILASAFLTKISYGVLVPPLLWFSFWLSKDKSVRNVSKLGGYLAVGAGLSLILNCTKNYIAFGEPLAPFFFLNSQADTQFISQEWFSTGNTKWILFTYPIALFLGKYPMQYGNLTPFCLLAIPFFYAGRMKDRVKLTTIQSIGITGLLGISTWIVIKPSVMAPRYITPAYILLFIYFAQISATNIKNIKVNSYRTGVYVLVLISLFLSLCHSWVSNNGEFYGPIQSSEKAIYKHVSSIENLNGLIYLNTYNSNMLSDSALACSSAVRRFVPGKYRNSNPEIWKQLQNQGYRYVISDETTHMPMSSPVPLGEKDIDIVNVISRRYSNHLVFYEIQNSMQVENVRIRECG